MQRHILVRSVILGISALTLGACGGGGSSTSSPGASAPAFTNGKVVDGYVSGAKVTLDINDDRICGASEPSVTTDSSGNYSFPGQGQHMVCVSGGTDLSTNQPLVGTLLAPPGATQATPLTTLVMAQLNISQGTPVAGTTSPVSGPDATAEATLIANKLGLTSTDILHQDPAATGGALATTTAAVQALMVKTAQTIQAAGGGGNSTNANTGALYADAAVATAAALASQYSALNTGTIGNIAGTVMNATLAGAKVDTAVIGLSKLASLSPASVTAFAAPTIQALTNAVAGATPASIGTPGSSNPAASAATNVALANTVATLADILLTTSANINTTALGSIAGATLSTGSNGVTTAASGSATVAAINSVTSGLGLTGSAGALLSIQLGGANSSQPVVLPTLGAAEDVGYLANATAVIDLNDNHVCDANEPSVTTDVAGIYSFDAALGTTHMVCVTGGIDTATGQPFTGVLLAPAGATEANVLTSLVTTMQLPNLSVSPALISFSLGLPAGTNPLTTDPIALSNSNPAPFNVSIKLKLMLTEIQGAIMAAGGNTDAAAAKAAYFDALNAAGSSISYQQIQGLDYLNIAATAMVRAQSDPALSNSALQIINPGNFGVFLQQKLNLDNASFAYSTPSAILDPQGPVASILGSPALNNLVSVLSPMIFSGQFQPPPSPISQIAYDAFAPLRVNSEPHYMLVLNDLVIMGIQPTAAQQVAVYQALGFQ